MRALELEQDDAPRAEPVEPVIETAGREAAQ
jgi:hypothetical protein